MPSGPARLTYQRHDGEDRTGRKRRGHLGLTAKVVRRARGRKGLAAPLSSLDPIAQRVCSIGSGCIHGLAHRGAPNQRSPVRSISASWASIVAGASSSEPAAASVRPSRVHSSDKSMMVPWSRSTPMPKDGDVASISWHQAPGAEKGEWKLIGGTGKFAGKQNSGWFQTVLANGRVQVAKWGGDCH